MSKIQSHRDLIVWQKGIDLAVLVYQLAEQLPKRETYGLWSQLTRAATSVPANIAEGHARSTSRDYANFLTIAKGSLTEVDTYLVLAERLGYLSPALLQPAYDLITEESKMLTALRNKLLQ